MSMSQKDLLKCFEDFLLDNLPVSQSFHNIFEDALQCMLSAGGKRFRPMLMLGVVNSYEPQLVQNSLKIALAIEMLHTYSLIHDDLPCMDDADLRRGHITLHKKYDETTAVLVGDALNTHSFNLLSTASLSAVTKIDIIQNLSSDGGINGMIIGQAIDCYFENKNLALEQIEFLHIHKTAKLIASSLKIGAIICNLSDDIQEKLYNFGISIGLLFQVQDDIIDEVQTSYDAGKTTNNDGDKNSFVKLLGLKQTIEYANNLSTKCKNELNQFDEKLNKNLSSLLNAYLDRHIQNN